MKGSISMRVPGNLFTFLTERSTSISPPPSSLLNQLSAGPIQDDSQSDHSTAINQNIKDSFVSRQTERHCLEGRRPPTLKSSSVLLDTTSIVLLISQQAYRLYPTGEVCLSQVQVPLAVTDNLEATRVLDKSEGQTV